MKSEVFTLSKENNTSLTCYLQEVKGKFVLEKRPAVIIIPGGSYQYCSDREADPVAFSFMRYGYDAFILRYTCKNQGSWPQPLNDYEDAMDIIIKNSERWGVDTNRIVAIGFSAGGHLAGCAATIAKNKPAATILVYPALCRDIIDMCMPNLPEPAKYVDSNTTPCFLIAARDDKTVDVKGSLQFELALVEKCIPFESHIYSYGGHGFSIVNALVDHDTYSERLPGWFDQAIGWLNEVLGKMDRDTISEPKKQLAKNSDGEDYLSIDCSIRHLMKQDKEVLEYLKPFTDTFDKIMDGVDASTVESAFGSITVRDSFEMNKVDKDYIESFNNGLKKFKSNK